MPFKQRVGGSSPPEVANGALVQLVSNACLSRRRSRVRVPYVPQILARTEFGVMVSTDDLRSVSGEVRIFGSNN